MRKRIIKIYATILAIGIPYLIFTLVTGKGLPCIYYETSGFLCPGCGASRMFMSMAKLDFVRAFRYNPVVFVLFFVWNAVAILIFLGKVKFVQSPRFIYTMLFITIAVLLIFCPIRNIWNII